MKVSFFDVVVWLEGMNPGEEPLRYNHIRDFKWIGAEGRLDLWLEGGKMEMLSLKNIWKVDVVEGWEEIKSRPMIITRRQWLQSHPRPKSPIGLAELLQAEQRRRLFKEGNLAEVAQNIATLTTEMANAAKCTQHQRGLHHHKNRPEDLFLCEVGPHFFFWTQVDGKPQLLPVASLALPGLDFPMTEGVTISEQEKPKPAA